MGKGKADDLGGRTLGLFAKQPLPLQVKTRLAADTNPQWAASVAEAFLRDLVDRLAGVAARRILAFAPSEAAPYFATLVQKRFELCPQENGDLGRRMEAFIDQRLQAGSEYVVLVGADSPTLPIDFVEQAFQLLEEHDVVLGPALDGGYYLLGCARRLPPLFEGIAWGSARVLLDSICRLTDASLRLAVLPPWYDVDTLNDWWALRGHLAALRAAGQECRLTYTERLSDPA